MNQKGISFLMVVIGLGILAVVGFFGYKIYQSVVNPTPVACTLEVKICPDGSAVGRQGPNCEFAPCPK